MKLKKIERDILYHLSRDGSISVTELAKILKTSKQVVSYNLNKLIEDKVIKGFDTIINYNLLSYNKYRILMKLSHASPKKEAEIIQFLKKNKSVAGVLQVDDFYDLIVYIQENNILDMYNLMIDIEEHYGDNVIETDFDMVAKDNYYSYRIFLDKKTAEQDFLEISYDKTIKTKELDDVDLKILGLIKNEARINYVSASAKIGVDPKTVVNRIKKLEKMGVIAGYRTLLDWRKLQKEHYKVLLDPFVYDREKFVAFKEHIRSNMQVIKMSEVISKYMLEFDIIVDKYTEILQFMSGLKEKYSDLIKGYDVIYIRYEG